MTPARHVDGCHTPPVKLQVVILKLYFVRRVFQLLEVMREPQKRISFFSFHLMCTTSQHDYFTRRVANFRLLSSQWQPESVGRTSFTRGRNGLKLASSRHSWKTGKPTCQEDRQTKTKRSAPQSRRRKTESNTHLSLRKISAAKGTVLKSPFRIPV